MNTRKSFISMSSALLAGAALAPNQAVARTTLRIGSSVADSVTPLLYAMSSKLFADSGLDVTLDQVKSGTAAAAGVAGGAYQTGQISTVPLIIAHEKGIPFVYVAPGGIYNANAPVTALLVRSDSPIRTAADLNGKVVAASAIGDLYALGTKNWVDLHGGNSETLKFVEFPPTAIPAALEGGRIDAGGLEEPALSLALASKKIRVLGYMLDSIARQFMISGWFTTLQFAKANRTTLATFRRDMRSASEYANRNHAQTVPILARFSSIPAAIIAGGTRVTNGLDLDPALIQPVIDLCAKYKTISAPFDASEMIDPASR